MTQTRLAWLFELLWLVFAAIVTLLVLMPLQGIIGSAYLTLNAAFIFLSVTFFRWFLFVKQVPYLSKLWMRVFLIMVIGVLFFQFMLRIQEFLGDMDNTSMSHFLSPEAAFTYSESLNQSYFYFKSEFILFATACQMMIVLLAIRLVVSLWQYGPKGKASMNR